MQSRVLPCLDTRSGDQGVSQLDRHRWCPSGCNMGGFCLIKNQKHYITALLRVMLVAGIRATGRANHNGFVLHYSRPHLFELGTKSSNSNRWRREEIYQSWDLNRSWLASSARSVLVDWSPITGLKLADSSQLLRSTLNLISPHLLETTRDPWVWLRNSRDFLEKHFAVFNHVISTPSDVGG